MDGLLASSGDPLFHQREEKRFLGVHVGVRQTRKPRFRLGAMTGCHASSRSRTVSPSPTSVPGTFVQKDRCVCDWCVIHIYIYVCVWFNCHWRPSKGPGHNQEWWSCSLYGSIKRHWSTPMTPLRRISSRHRFAKRPSNLKSPKSPVSVAKIR